MDVPSGATSSTENTWARLWVTAQLSTRRMVGAGYLVAELEQLALNAAVAPAVVRPRHAFDQRNHGIVDWRPLGPVRVGSLLRDQASAPSQDGAWCHQSMLAQRPGESAHRGGEHRTIGPVRPRAGIGPTQHGVLVSQHQQLDVLGGRRPAKRNQPAHEPDEDQVQQS